MHSRSLFCLCSVWKGPPTLFTLFVHGEGVLAGGTQSQKVAFTMSGKTWSGDMAPGRSSEALVFFLGLELPCVAPLLALSRAHCPFQLGPQDSAELRLVGSEPLCAGRS